MSKEPTALEALEKVCNKGCDFCDLYNYEHNKNCKEEMGGCANCIFCGKEHNIIESELKNYEQIKKCHLVAIPRMSNKTSIVDELLSLQEAIRVMTTILHYSYTNRFIVKQAFDEGWINEEQYQLMIETFGYYNCTGKEEPNESKRNIDHSN